ncbi:enoyl-CoA hydratase/isomerase family protein [Microbacterium sp. LRZ72]|uniref:enoyl-CoA hydratase/isomerase family protein n=1 Tax=Microbacterium sp. LRZ72 TaxID=2942481 RepID=UPI0029B1BBE0|nr:enoyl-CoA hydratase/isomerase family protein [Microbacterium sp. LRZ72]MDX2376428.1 enoyl-CoA hydratase/isomerase family protein [Microbacterium sp. LRZ72]
MSNHVDGHEGVRIRSARGLGRLTLDRPRAINALDRAMVGALTDALDRWRDDPDVERVLIDGAGERGLCAGGDVRGVVQLIAAGRLEQVADFFRAEYALNALIAGYPKPIVAFADGVTMGGGIGLAGHASVRVVTERSRLAMPETRIGMSPDVGGTRLLARAPGRLGEYLALTGATMDAADAIHAGFADHLVPSERLPDVLDALETRADPAGAAELMMLFDETPDEAALARARPWIDDCFSAPTLAQIIERLRARPEPQAGAAADELALMSPTALAVALDAVRSARRLPHLRAVLEQEYAIMMWFAATQPDLPEGVRALLVDKDRSPRWNPPRIGDVASDAGAQAMAFVPALPLW